MVLNLLNLYSLIIALFGKINTMTNESQVENETSFTSAPTILTTRLGITLGHQIETTTQRCFQMQVNCDPSSTAKNITAALMTIMIVNATTVPYNPTSTAIYESTDGYAFTSAERTSVSSMTTQNYTENPTPMTAYEDNDLSSTPTMIQNYTTEPRFDNTTSLGNVSTTYDDDDGEYEYEPINEDNLDSSLSIVYPDSATASDANITTEDYYDLNFQSVSISQGLRVERAGACYKTVCNSSADSLVKIPENLDSIPSSGRIQRDDHHSKKLCWETMFGQELVKLTVMDLVIFSLNVHAHV